MEARSGAGVGWFAPNGELLGVEFDDATFDQDHQTLVFANGESVEVDVTRGKVSVKRKRIRNVA